jgi:hypothetical protein
MKKVLKLGHVKLGATIGSPAGVITKEDRELWDNLDDLVIFWIEEMSHPGDRPLFLWDYDSDSKSEKYLCTLDEWPEVEAAVKKYN